LFHSRLRLCNAHWIDAPEIERVKYCQIRYRDDAVPCQLNMLSDDNLSVNFDETPVYAAAPGQVAAFYSADNQECLGHAIIDDLSVV
jgi:tRNA U34 2-thiouridine synthase MnmA/TrmU